MASRGRRRGDAELDPRLKDIVDRVGKDKLAPDMSAEERYYSRSLKFRQLIAEFLTTHEGTTWANYTELNNRAGNYAGCSSVTAARWVSQLTVVGTAHKIVQGVGYLILERRGDNGQEEAAPDAEAKV